MAAIFSGGDELISRSSHPADGVISIGGECFHFVYIIIEFATTHSPTEIY